VLLTIPRTFTVKIVYRDYAFKKLFFINLAYFGTMTIATFYLMLNEKALVLGELLWISFSGAAAGSALGLILTAKELRFSLTGKINFRQVYRFSIPLTIQGALHYMPKVLDTMLILKFFDATLVGTYTVAKNIFRIFDEAASASHGLIYPAAVRQIENNNMSGLNALMTKAISFMLFMFIAIVLLLEAGLSKFFINTFLPSNYHPAIPQFNVLVLSALFLPLTLLSLIINAFGNTRITLRYVVYSFIFSMAVFFIIGKMHNPNTVALGLTAYYAMYGGLCYYYSFKHLDFRPVQLLRAFADTYNFLKSFMAKRKGRTAT
jgi:O-antigen/teichoic acid export membrane protein